MEIRGKVKKIIENPCNMIMYLGNKGRLKWLSDEVYLKAIFNAKLNKNLDLGNPKSFNEKLQWLKLYDRNPKYSKLVDKYEVREFISNSIGEEYLIPMIGVWDSVDEINFELLPKQFVLKCTHDSGSVVVCTDKEELDVEKVKKKLNIALKRNYYYPSREWTYKNVKPRIIAEQYMVNDSGEELKDYKFMCFNGEVKCSFVCLNRYSGNGLNVNFYDMNWNLMPFERHYPCSKIKVEKPTKFEKMVELATILSQEIPFVRVDFYEINGSIYFGELTFYPGAGYEEFTPEEYDYILGSWIKLPKVQ